MKAYKIEYYPDMAGAENGKKVFTVGFNVNNEKRFKVMSNKERKTLLKNIRRFESVLGVFKARIRAKLIS